MSQDHTRLPPTRGEGQGQPLKARPILFSGPMVRALLAGTKTQTRRIVKFVQGAASCSCERPLWRSAVPDDWHCGTCGAGVRGARANFRGLACPYGVPGDLLWVRESIHQPNAGGFIYRANWREQAEADGYDNIPADESATRWTPSIHMPRIASRLTLEITEVRVERLQDISYDDCRDEGTVCPIHGTKRHTACSGLREGYRTLWNSINGDGSWAANPWVWAVSFKVHRQNFDALTHPPGGHSHEG